VLLILLLLLLLILLLLLLLLLGLGWCCCAVCGPGTVGCAAGSGTVRAPPRLRRPHPPRGGRGGMPGSVIGIVVGAAAACALLGVLCFWVYLNRRKKRQVAADNKAPRPSTLTRESRTPVVYLGTTDTRE